MDLSQILGGSLDLKEQQLLSALVLTGPAESTPAVNSKLREYYQIFMQLPLHLARELALEKLITANSVES